MKATFALLVSFFVLSLSSSVPVYIWAGEPVFSKDHSQLSKPVRNFALQQTIAQLVSNEDLGTPLASSLSQDGAGKTEVVVAFVAEKLGTTEASVLGGAFQGQDYLVDLKEAVKSSRSSLTIPYLYGSETKLSADLVDTIRRASPEGQIISMSLATSQCQNILSQLTQSKDIFSNGHTDLIVISFTDYRSQNVGSCLSRVQSLVQQHAGEKYLSLLSANSPSKTLQMRFPTESESQQKDYPVNLFSRLERTSLLSNKKRLQATSSVNPGPQYITPAILFGILLGFSLLFFLWQGISAVTAIETPVRFSHTKLQLSREY